MPTLLEGNPMKSHSGPGTPHTGVFLIWVALDIHNFPLPFNSLDYSSKRLVPEVLLSLCSALEILRLSYETTLWNCCIRILRSGVWCGLRDDNFRFEVGPC